MNPEEKAEVYRGAFGKNNKPKEEGAYHFQWSYLLAEQLNEASRDGFQLFTFRPPHI